MAIITSIEWATHTFNPWIGCTKVSPACEDCYAELVDARYGYTQQGWGHGRPRHRTATSNWKQPLAWNRAALRTGTRSKVFCASLADVFDQEVDPAWRDDLWNLIRQCPQLDWQILTKRPQFISRCLPRDWGNGWPHVWLGTSVENQNYANLRIPLLQAVPAVVHFLSIEPLIAPIVLPTLRDIEWVIVGGESGRTPRRMHPKWVNALRRQCTEAGVGFFFKQWGGTNKKANGRTLNGRTYDEMPFVNLTAPIQLGYSKTNDDFQKEFTSTN